MITMISVVSKFLQINRKRHKLPFYLELLSPRVGSLAAALQDNLRDVV